MRTVIEYTGFNEVMDKTIRDYAKECDGIGEEIGCGYLMGDGTRDITFAGCFTDVHDEIELVDMGQMYELTVLTEE